MTHIKLGMILFVGAALTACNSRTTEPTSSSPDAIITKPPSAPPASPVAPDEIIAPREDDRSVVVDHYSATEGPYRLFGTSMGDDVLGASAVIADAKSWSTRAYRVGDLVGRGLNVAKIEEHSVTLESASEEIVLGAGKDVPLRVITHRFDIVAQPLGRMNYVLDLAAAKAAPATSPTAEKTELYGETVLKLGPVASDSLLAAADFKEGDLLAGIDGAPIGDDGVARLQKALTSGTGNLQVRVIRAGVPYDRTYAKKPAK